MSWRVAALSPGRFASALAGVLAGMLGLCALGAGR